MEPNHETVRHLLDNHSMTIRDVAVLFRCREDSLRNLLVVANDDMTDEVESD